MLLQFLTRELRVAQQTAQQTCTDRFACVDGDYRCSAIGVPNEVVATFGAYYFEAKSLESSEKLLARDGRKLAQAFTVMR
jgi:hypothetical protein